MSIIQPPITSIVCALKGPQHHDSWSEPCKNQRPQQLAEFNSSEVRMRKLPPLGALRAFEAAARHLSFKRAADELAVTPTAISHQVRLLEDTLRRRLFDRKAKRVHLTASGQLLYPLLRDSFDAISRGVSAVSDSRHERTIVFTATLAFTSRWLVPRMAAFRVRFPNVGVRLLASDDVVDLRIGAADLAIRFGGGNYPGCRSDRLLPGTFGPVCSPTLGVRKLDDVARHPLIHFEWRHLTERTPSWPRWFAEAGRPYPKGGPKLVFSDETHAIQAALTGQGIVLASLALVRDDLKLGTLVNPFGPVLESHGFYVVTSADRAQEETVRDVREWLLVEAGG
jgi:LysR family glycine cleavage system transcriptional activator